jgi:hypothetical protein
LPRRDLDLEISDGAMASKEYLLVADELDQSADDPSSAQFKSALEKLKQLAEAADMDACEALAEILCTESVYEDPASAYRWYYIALSQKGYGVEFHDLNHSPPNYGGEVGDFRNESMVSDLVSTLGFERVRELDREAAAWLRAHGLQANSRRTKQNR